ncbi:MAG TPA: hypothetical protein VEM32_11645 [Geobacteraceae bacterium]|nr:hypothetical protein [Geobacteraceae bacterium]
MRNFLHKIKIVSIGSYLADLAVYAIFVFGYFFLVRHFLGDQVKQVFDANKKQYAILALALIVVQGVFLEMLTSAMMRVLRHKVR